MTNPRNRRKVLRPGCAKESLSHLCLQDRELRPEEIEGKEFKEELVEVGHEWRLGEEVWGWGLCRVQEG